MLIGRNIEGELLPPEERVYTHPESIERTPFSYVGSKVDESGKAKRDLYTTKRTMPAETMGLKGEYNGPYFFLNISIFGDGSYALQISRNHTDNYYRNFYPIKPEAIDSSFQEYISQHPEILDEPKE